MTKGTMTFKKGERRLGASHYWRRRGVTEVRSTIEILSAEFSCKAEHCDERRMGGVA